MKLMISPIDIKYIIDELKCLEGSKIDTVFHKDSKIIIKTDGHELLVSPDLPYLTKKVRIDDVSDFALLLRKHLKTKTIENIEQYGFANVVEMAIEDGLLILEFFDGGNCILCDSSYNIIMPREFKRSKDRQVVAKERYMYPRVFNIIDIVELKRLLSSKKTIAEIFNGLLGRYAGELLKLSGMDKDKPANELDIVDIERLHSQIRSFVSREKKPQVVYKNKKLIDVLAFDMELYKDNEKKYFSSFSEALDFFFSKVDYMDVLKRSEKKKRKLLKKKKRKKKKKK